MQAKRGTIEWLRERIRHQHHAVIMKYIMSRTAEQKNEADAAGLDVNTIIRQAFAVKNGPTAVPADALQLLRNVWGVDPEIVWNLCSTTPDKRQLKSFVKVIRYLLKKERVKMTPALTEILDLATVQEVLES